MVEVSIIIPVYNCEKYLIRCIESVTNQTFKDLQIVIINDGSTDNCKNIINEYAYRDKRVVNINLDHKGVSYARNEGLRIVEGEYICFLDADDWLEKEAIDLLMQCKKNNNTDLVIADYFIVDEASRKKINYHHLDNLSKDNLKDSFFYGIVSGQVAGFIWGKLYKTEIIRKNKIEFLENLVIMSDSVFNVDYLRYVKVITVLNIPVINYLSRFGSLSRKYRNDLFKKCYEVFQIIDNILKKTEDFKKLHLANLSAMFNHVILWSIMQEAQRQKVSYTEYIKNCKIIINSIESKKILRELVSNKYLKTKLELLSFWLLKRNYQKILFLIFWFLGRRKTVS